MSIDAADLCRTNERVNAMPDKREALRVVSAQVDEDIAAIEALLRQARAIALREDEKPAGDEDPSSAKDLVSLAG